MAPSPLNLRSGPNASQTVRPVMLGPYPNITGWVHVGVNSNSVENWTSDGGLFYNSGIGTGGQAPITGRDGRQIWFSPNRVCSLYGKSSTIQANSCHVLIIIKI